MKVVEEGKRVYISVVVPTHNRKERLRRCLRALMAQDYPAYEVIVVDDGSTDGTDEMVRQEFPQVHYLRQEHRGPAAARNRGIRAARGEIVAFTDDDCEPPPEWLRSLWEGFQHYPEAGAVGGIQEPTAHALSQNLLARYESFVTYRIYGVGERAVVGSPAPGGTNNLAVPKYLLERLGGFDETFPVAAGEDADLLYRIADLGYKTVCLPNKVVHHHTYTWRAFVRQQVQRGVGAAYFLRKRGALPPWWRESVRPLVAPLLYMRDVVRYRETKLTLLHQFASLLQWWGRVSARWQWQRQPHVYAWRVAPSPVKLRYITRYAVGPRVLDVGTGSGFYARFLREQGYHVVGVDLAPTLESRISVVQARLCALPFASPFDTVLAFDVLEHEADEAQALTELRRLTRHRLLLSVPNADHGLLPVYNLTYKHHLDKTHHRTYTEESLRARLEAAGFKVLVLQREGPVHPAVLAEFVRPSLLRTPVRMLLTLLHRLRVLYNPRLMADLYVVAEPRNGP